MKLLVNTLKYIGITVAILFTSFVVAIEFAEEAIVGMTLNEVNNNLDASIEIDQIHFSMFTHFPQASLECKTISLKKSDQDSIHLLQLKDLSLLIRIKPLLKNKIEISELKLNDGHINYHINSLGTSNFDFLLNDTVSEEVDSIENPLLVSIPSLRASNIRISYLDNKEQVKGKLQINNIQSAFEYSPKGLEAHLLGEIDVRELIYPNTKVHLMKLAQTEFDLTLQNNTVELKNILFLSDGITLKVNGELSLANKYPLNIQLLESHFQLNELAKYLPDSIIQNYNIKDIGGTVLANAHVKGEALDSIMPYIEANLKLEEGQFITGTYPKIKNMLLEASYSNGEQHNLKSSNIRISDFLLETDSSHAQLSLYADNLEQPKYKITSQLNVLLEEFSDFLPDDMDASMAGRLKVDLENKGRMPKSFDSNAINQLLSNSVSSLNFDNIQLNIDSTLNIKELNGQIKYFPNHFDLSALSCSIPQYDLKLYPSNLSGNFKADLSQLDHATLNIDTFNVKVNNSQLFGHFSFANGLRPSYKINSFAKLQLDDWKQFIPDSILSTISGQVQANVFSQGSFNPDSISDDVMNLLFTNSQLKIKTTDLNVLTSDKKIRLEDFYGKMELQGDSIYIEKLSGAFNETEFMADSTRINSLYNAVLLNQAKQIEIEGSFHLDELDYAMIEAFLTKDSASISEEDPTEAELSNYSFLIKGKASAHSLKYNKATFYNVASLFRLSDSLYILDDLQFEAFSGKMKNSIKYKIEPNNRQEIWVKNNIQKMDIEQLLREFDNFEEYGNTNITHEQISGLFTTHLDGHFVMEDGEVLYDLIELSGDMQLEEGRLINYELAAEMGRENNIDNLDNLEFNTIDTKVFIHKNVIYIPRTNINNNALDVTIYGRQEFGDDCKYHLRFYLKELLKRGEANTIERKKNKKSTKDHGGVKGASNIFVFYEIEDGKTTMWRESKKSKKAEKLRMIIKMQETGLKIVFDPKAVSYDTGVN